MKRRFAYPSWSHESYPNQTGRQSRYQQREYLLIKAQKSGSAKRTQSRQIAKPQARQNKPNPASPHPNNHDPSDFSRIFPAFSTTSKTRAGSPTEPCSILIDERSNRLPTRAQKKVLRRRKVGGGTRIDSSHTISLTGRMENPERLSSPNNLGLG